MLDRERRSRVVFDPRTDSPIYVRRIRSSSNGGERPRMRRRLLALTLGAALVPTATAHAATPLEISSVSAVNARTLEVRFNQTLSRDLINMVAANNSNTSYLHQFIRLSGGQAGGPDAALTGTAPLSTQASGTRNYTVETVADDRCASCSRPRSRSPRAASISSASNTGDGTPLASHLFTGRESGLGHGRQRDRARDVHRRRGGGRDARPADRERARQPRHPARVPAARHQRHAGRRVHQHHQLRPLRRRGAARAGLRRARARQRPQGRTTSTSRATSTARRRTRSRSPRAR